MNNSGIYKIINCINNKIYIGSSIDLKKREHLHFSISKSTKKNQNIHLRNSMDKYGRKNFKFEIIEIINISELNKEDIKNKLISREQYYLDYLKPWDKKIGYNMCKLANSRLGVIMSEESKKKLSESKKGKPSPKKGIKVSEEVRKINSESHKGLKASEQTKQKISENQKGEKNTRAKLNEKQVLEIKQLLKEGHKLKHISDIYKVGLTTISEIKVGRLWKHIV